MIYEVTVDHADSRRCLGFLVHEYVEDDAPEDLTEFYHTLAREGYAVVVNGRARIPAAVDVLYRRAFPVRDLLTGARLRAACTPIDVPREEHPMAQLTREQFQEMQENQTSHLAAFARRAQRARSVRRMERILEDLKAVAASSDDAPTYNLDDVQQDAADVAVQLLTVARALVPGAALWHLLLVLEERQPRPVRADPWQGTCAETS